MVTSKKNSKCQINNWYFVVVAFAAVLVVLNLLRIFDNNFWGDEAYTIMLSKMKFIVMD